MPDVNFGCGEIEYMRSQAQWLRGSDVAYGINDLGTTITAASARHQHGRYCWSASRASSWARTAVRARVL
jgi:hypothetical protein